MSTMYNNNYNNLINLLNLNILNKNNTNTNIMDGSAIEITLEAHIYWLLFSVKRHHSQEINAEKKSNLTLISLVHFVTFWRHFVLW